MNEENIRKQFEAIGADIKFEQSNRVTNGASIDVRNDTFVLRYGESPVTVQVVHSDPADRHLLLFVKNLAEPKAQPVKILAGHDERHWFVAGVERRATTVAQAKESLKPAAVREAERQAGLNRKAKGKRHNNAFIRQGEWFFIPRPDMNPPKDLILRNEPLRRATGSNAHMVEELYRIGGTTVWVCMHYREGLTKSQYEHVMKSNPMASKYRWTTMTRNPRMYARGSVRHCDHATVFLDGWHEIVMNNEKSDKTIAYLD
jgi:hypothetical protein